MFANNQLQDFVGTISGLVRERARHAKMKDGVLAIGVRPLLSEGQMRPLITAKQETIDKVLPKIIAEGWSARKVEQYMVEEKARAQAAAFANPRPANAESDARAASLSEKIGFKVKVRTNTKGAGDIVIKFNNEKEYEKICSILTA